MQLLRSAISSILVGLILSGLIFPTYATAADIEVIESQTMDSAVQTVEDSSDPTNGAEIVELDDLNVQLNDLYYEIGEQLNIDYMYVKILHMLAGGKAVYADASPNIRIDETVDSLPGAFEIPGADQTWELTADWIICPDETVERPSKNYLPDAAYNVTADVVAIMNTRYYADRGNMQEYFDALNNNVKTTIIFCESVLQYTGSTPEAVNSFYSIYEKLLYDKDNDENVLEANQDGTYTFKPNFLSIIKDNGISTDREIEILSTILRFDASLAASSSMSELSDTYAVPYIIGYQSRENMMIAAMSVVGKVRYVWGGGHLGTGAIKGINPNWGLFYNTYGTNVEEDGYLRCVKPTISWCPIHGTTTSENGCLFASENVYSAEEFIDERSSVYNTAALETEAFSDMLEKAGVDSGITSHRLDGLDCSGYASWVYNQVQDSVTYDSGALRFISQRGITSLPEGTKLLPGDVFSWGAHIIVIVGAVGENSRAYVMVESGPNVVKFGVAYYSGASSKDLELAKALALEANQLIGNLDAEEPVRSFNMTNCVYSAGDDENYASWNGYHAWGRLTKTFIDEATILSEYGKTIKEMTAQEIIQHTINNLPYHYLSGISNYEGQLFSTDVAEQSVSDIVAEPVKPTQIVLTDELSNIVSNLTGIEVEEAEEY